MNINKSQNSKLKIVFTVFLILLLHLLVVLISVCGYKVYQSYEQERELKTHLGETVDEEQLAGSVFEYDLKYTLADGEVREMSGKEIYYWDGNKFVPVSEFMK